MRSFIIPALSVLAISACTPMEVTTPPVMVTPKDKSSAMGLDVYAVARSKGNPVPSFRGQETVAVRTQGKTEGGSFGEISGVPCKLDAGVYDASFRTPANLVVPDYGPNSPAIFVRCVLAERSGSATVNSANWTAQQRQASTAGTGLLGAIILGAVAESKRNDQVDEFKYPPITIQLK